MSLKDKGNAWKLVYAALVLTENAPKVEEGCLEDEEGNIQDAFFTWTPKDLKLNIKGKENEEIEYRKIQFSDALNTFVYEYENGKLSFPFTYESYLKNDDIINTIEAYELDVEQFWYAILAVYWLTQIRCVNTIKSEGSIGEQMKKLSEYLQRIDCFTITAEGKKKLVINDVGVIRYIREFLDELLEDSGSGFMSGYSISMGSQGDRLESSSVQMWFSTERFLKLFENLDLPTIRATDSKIKYKNEFGERVAVSGEIKTVSYNKMLLVSRLIYFMRLTKNDNFLYTDESLKGIIKQYKNLEINTYNPKHWSF